MTVVRSTGAALIAHDSQGARSGVGMGALPELPGACACGPKSH